MADRRMCAAPDFLRRASDALERLDLVVERLHDADALVPTVLAAVAWQGMPPFVRGAGGVGSHATRPSRLHLPNVSAAATRRSTMGGTDWCHRHTHTCTPVGTCTTAAGVLPTPSDTGT